MSWTKARTISSLRMRRCSQGRNNTNCTPAEATAVKMAYQWAGMGVLGSAAACRRFSCGHGEWLRLSRLFPRGRESRNGISPRLEEKREEAPALHTYINAPGNTPRP